MYYHSKLMMLYLKRKFFTKVISERTAIYLILLTVLTFITAIIIFSTYGSWKKTKFLDESIIGQFGDFIGGVIGTLVALIGIILYYIALNEQRKDIKINQRALNLQLQALNQQITEFQEQRQELVNTRRIYEQQSKTMKNQQFDSNFYSLLNVFLSIKSDLNKTVSSKDYFKDLCTHLDTDVNKSTFIDFLGTHYEAIRVYGGFYFANRGRLSSYFKTIYRLIKLVDECDHFSNQEKIFYSKIIRSQISEDELVILYYNYNSVYGKSVQHLVLKYNFLKHIQRLSKIEFKRHFIFGSLDNKNKIELFIEWLLNLIRLNLDFASDIEYTQAIEIEEIYQEYNFIVGIYIDIDLEIKIIIKREDIPKLPFSIIKFSTFIKTVLYDYLFLERFKIESLSAVKESKIEDEEKITLRYLIENI